MQIYIVVPIAILVIIAALFYFVGRRQETQRLTHLASLAFGFILAGILFGEDRFVGYSLMGIGVVLAVIDIVKRTKAA